MTNRVLLLSTKILLLYRLSRGSCDKHTVHVQAIMGTPLLVPVPKNVTLMEGVPMKCFRNVNLFLYLLMHEFIIQLLTLVREIIDVDGKQGQKINKGVDAAFCLKKLIEHNHFFSWRIQKPL